MDKAANRIRQLYTAINQRDVPQAVRLIDENCRYEDLNFSATFMGKVAVQGLFSESCQAVPADLRFVIDDIAGDDFAVGLTWHVELSEGPFPNGRGVSFYRFSPETNKLIFARDCVEPAIKPGKAAFTLIRWLTPVARSWLRTQSDSQANDQGTRLKQLLWLATAVYVGLLLLSPPSWLPGEPVWAIQPETITEVLNESLNFFFILPGLNLLGISYLQAPTVHPATQGFFNLAEAWIFMFLPLMWMDGRSRQLPRLGLWGCAMFLTNVFLMPYMALRLGKTAEPPQHSLQKGTLGRVFGSIGLMVGTLAILWFCLNQPTVGGVLNRVNYLGQQLVSNRVTLAFAVDMALFWIFQIWLMGAIIPIGERLRGLRFLPFWGLGIWLVV